MKDDSQEKESTKPDGGGAAAADHHILTALGLFFLEVIKVILLAGITIVLVRYFLFKPFYVKGQSMEPTFFEHEYLIIDELTYRLKDPVRGEVVVFRAPVTHEDYYLKRIVGLPGERVKVEDSKIIIFNDEHPQGVVVEEEYFSGSTHGSLTLTLEPDEYFVLGDNRSASYDSRRFGPIHRRDIVGRTWLRGWPITRVSTFQPPEYNF